MRRSRRPAAPFTGMDDHSDLFPLLDVDLREPLLIAAQVARLLSVPRSSVYEYARRRHGPLPSITVGRHRRFCRSDLEAWLAAQRVADQ